MTARNKWLWYGLFVLVLTVFFLYALFPGDKIRNYMVFQLNKAHPDISIAIDRLKPALPPGIKLYNVSVRQMDDTLLVLENIKITPDFLSLLRSNTIFFFKATTCDGKIDGKGEITRNSAINRIHIDAAFNDVKVAKIDALQGLNRQKISGVLEGHFNYTNDMGADENLKATVVIADAEVELLNPFFTLNSIAFNVIESTMAMKNRKIQFKQCTLKGPQMNGSIAGSIALVKPLQRSSLNLVGAIKLQPSFLAELEKDLPKNLIPQKFFNKNGLSMKLNGTIGKPIFSIK